MVGGIVSNTMYPTKLYSGGSSVISATAGSQNTNVNPAFTNGMNGNLVTWNNTWGSGTGPTGWTTNSQAVYNHKGSIRAEYAMGLASNKYPQVGSSVLLNPVSLSTNAANSSPNNNAYNIVPKTTIPYELYTNPLYQIPNVCNLMGY